MYASTIRELASPADAEALLKIYVARYVPWAACTSPGVTRRVIEPLDATVHALGAAGQLVDTVALIQQQVCGVAFVGGSSLFTSPLRLWL